MTTRLTETEYANVLARRGLAGDAAQRAGIDRVAAEMKQMKTAIHQKKHPLNEFLLGLSLLGLPEPVLEYKFHPERKWRLDAAWVEHFPFRKAPDVASSLKIAIEYNGIHGGHNPGHASIRQLMRDYEKLNEAQLLGWLVITLTAESIRTGKAHEWVREAFRQRGFSLE